MKGYKDELDNHWVTVTGYSDDYSVVVSNNGRMEELDLNELSHRRLFIAIAAISVK
jgi:D-serine dehydratase